MAYSSESKFLSPNISLLNSPLNKWSFVDSIPYWVPSDISVKGYHSTFVSLGLPTGTGQSPYKLSLFLFGLIFLETNPYLSITFFSFSKVASVVVFSVSKYSLFFFFFEPFK